MLLGIDLGTGSAKALLLATDGTAIGEVGYQKLSPLVRSQVT
jgi:sugar (pentulose or hexulose) kinase